MSYDPTQGRFAEQDPDGYPDGPNRYEPLRSNPLKYLDPSGTVYVPIDVISQIIKERTEDQAVIERARQKNNIDSTVKMKVVRVYRHGKIATRLYEVHDGGPLDGGYTGYWPNDYGPDVKVPVNVTWHDNPSYQQSSGVQGGAVRD